MIRLSTILVCIALALLGNANAESESAADTRPALVVLGVASTGNSQEWREGLAGFGVENWVAQALYDSGKYRLIELMPEVLATYQPKLAKTYDLIAKAKKSDVEPLGELLGADVIAVGKVTATWPERSHAFIGVINQDSRDTVVKVDVCLYDLKTGKSVKATGTGKVGHSDHSFGADRPNGLAFDPETVGRATNAAVENAIASLVPGYKQLDRTGGSSDAVSPFAAGVLPLAMSPDVARLYPELRTRRVQLGLHNRIVKAMSGCAACTLQEINPDILQSLETQWWVAANGAPPLDEVTAHADELKRKVDWLVYGEIFSFSAGTLEKMNGLAGKLANKVTMGVQLRAVKISGDLHVLVLASGTGTATGDWEAWKGSDIDFEQTFVGEASGKAIGSAWPALLREISRVEADRR